MLCTVARVAAKGSYPLSCISVRIMLYESGGQCVQHHGDFMHRIRKRLNLKYVY